jgi:hypothetical protein
LPKVAKIDENNIHNIDPRPDCSTAFKKQSILSVMLSPDSQLGTKQAVALKRHQEWLCNLVSA